MGRNPDTGKWGWGPKEVAACANCGRFFLRPEDERWRTTCVNCFSSKNANKFRDQSAGYQSNIGGSAGATTHRLTLELDPDELRFLLLIAHPDRHTDDPHRTQIATAITRKLIALRKR